MVPGTLETFLLDASTNKNLQRMREESTPVNAPAIPAVAEGELDVFEADDGANTELLGDTPVGYPKKPKRRTSKTLLALLHKHDARLKCEGSDTSCLIMLVANRVGELDYGKDLKRLERVLGMLQKVVGHIQPSTSTQRNVFVQLTAIFKEYWVKKGETNRMGPHVELVRQVLRAEASLVAHLLTEKEARLRQKLSDKYREDYQQVERNVRHQYNRGMNNNDPSRQDMIAMMLGLITSAGMRKTAIVDPNITFVEYRSDVSNFRLGDPDDDENALIETNNGDWKEAFGYKHFLIQRGVLKDKAQEINKYLELGDDRFIMNRSVYKPTIVLTAKEIIAGVRAFRKYFGITKTNFKGRVTEGNRFGTNDFNKIMREYYPNSWAKAKKNGYGFSSHHGRKIYGNASYEIYKDQVQQVTSRYFDRSVWLATVLAHGGSIKTSLSYSNIDIDFRLSNEVFKLPPEHQMRLFQGQVDELKSQMTDMIKSLGEASASAKVELATNQVAFTTPDGHEVTLTKHKSRNYKSTRDRDLVIKDASDRLKENGLEPTVTNIAKLGFSPNTVRAYKKGLGVVPSKQPAPEPVRSDEDVPIVVPDELKNDREIKHVELPVGTRVVVSGKTENALNMAMKRDRARFGADNVVADEACDGTVLKKQRIPNPAGKGKTLVRDLCVDER